MAAKRYERDIAYMARKKRRKEKKEKRKRIEREAEEKGLEPPPKQIPATLENTRVPDDTIVRMADKEVLEDEATDEFHEYFAKGKAPQIMITTRPRPSRYLFEFIKALTNLFPRAQFTPRGKQNIKELSASAAKQGFTHLIVLSEKNKICNGMMISHLRTGPTALFKVTTIKVASKLSKHGNPTSHIPEILLNNFNTRLGHRVGRLLGSLFPHNPDFMGRQVVTFHNQRDFVFIRRHRYIFESAEKTRLQELGPRFTLKLKWLQAGTFDTKTGEYEWVRRRNKIRTKFAL